MKEGKFLVFEGLNFCGKDTQIKNLFNYFNSQSKSEAIFVTKEPNKLGEDKNGENDRTMLAKEKDPYENSKDALAYFSGNRKKHNEIFLPLLMAGSEVISNRYYYSQFAFQKAQVI